ncbi:MAG TPA: LysR family transcriptional regulator [Bryobacteraceae bacterium]|jgi:DNA-binding transcriptional LysR family regulator|nr:LysR family transcriptional regulator [Bryobacteraceae bacterium]
MDLRLLQYFVAAAELEHIGKAAERLHISQSPLSRQIRQLEKELHLELFVRERQRVRLTEPGRWLLGHARKLLAYADKIRDEAGQKALGKMGTVSISFVSGALWSGILPKPLRRFQTEFPNANVELRNLRSAQQFEAISSGRIDIGFVSNPAIGNDVEQICVAEEPYLLVVPGAHPLSRKRTIRPSDLDGASWVLLSRSTAPERYAEFLAACANAGFVPRMVQAVSEPNTLLGLVESGLGVGLVQSSARNYAPRSVKFRALPWISLKSRTYMVRPSHGRQPLADCFAAFVPKINMK